MPVMRENGAGGSCAAEDGSPQSFVVIDGGSDGSADSADSAGGDGAGGEQPQQQHSFARTLDSKLKKLQRHAGGGNKAQPHASRKPVFVTTVKTGIFLDPPPDLAVLLGLDDRSPPQSSSAAAAAAAADSDRYYSYCSRPRVLYDKQHQLRTSAAATRKTDRQSDMCKQMGYTNIMHDKRVVRGSNFAKKPFVGKESSAAREAESRRRAMARKKAMDYQTRALRLHLGAPKLNRGRQNVDIQTDTQLEELYDYPPSQTFGAQTEFDQELFSNPGTGTSAGTDASTQVDDKDLFDFDVEVTPIAESLIADVFRQAMREVLYEDELDARARQQRALYLRRTIEEIEKQRLEQEDKRLSKVIAEHAQLFDEGEKNEKIRIAELSVSSRVTNLLPKVLNDLNQNEYTTANVVENSEFVSWLVDELQAVKPQHFESDEILTNIIHDLVKRRLDAYDEVTEVKNIEKPVKLFEEIESVTSSPYDPKIEADNRTTDS